MHSAALFALSPILKVLGSVSGLQPPKTCHRQGIAGQARFLDDFCQAWATRQAFAEEAFAEGVQYPRRRPAAYHAFGVN